jgi:hypothetical protein
MLTTLAQAEPITRDNIDTLLDAGQLEVLMSSGSWWRIRRNGATRRWKRDASRIYVPYKAGMYTYGAITESDFNGANGSLYSNSGYRRAQE